MDTIRSKNTVKSDKIYLRQLKLRELLEPHHIPEPRLNVIIFEIEQLFKVEE